MRILALACLLLMALPHVPLASADPPMTCTPVGPCVPLQKQYDDLVGNNLEAVSGANVGWLNLEPGNVQFQPLLDFPTQLLGSARDYTDSMAALVAGAGQAVAGDAAATAGSTSVWVLGTVGSGSGRASASVYNVSNAGDALVVVTVGEGTAWLSFVTSSGVTLASATLTLAETAPGSTSAMAYRTAFGVANGAPEYALLKAAEATARIVQYTTNPPTGAVQRDVDENGLGDTWEDTVCRSRFGEPGLPPDACQAVDGVYHMARSYATADFDQDGLDLIDEFRWNSDPTNPDTDRDGLPDGPEANVWRHSENDLVVDASLWTCPASGFEDTHACAWRHPDSFRDDDKDGFFNMGQDPNGPLAALGPGDADSENDGLRDGDEYYGCWTDPVYGANPHADPDIPGFDLCGGNAERGHDSDLLESDTDGDGLTDAQEVCSATGGACSRLASYGTDPQAPDSDGDSWFDGEEAAFWRTHGGWFNDIDGDGVVNNLADPDSDRDGLQDGVEAKTLQTRADLPDTDGDGMPDQWEVRNNFDPRNPADGGVMSAAHRCVNDGPTNDADGDGLCNAFEYGFQKPAAWSEIHDGEWHSVLNPRQADMDGDQLMDGQEIFPVNPNRFAQQDPSISDAPLGQHYYSWDAAYPGYAGSTRVDVADTDGDGLSDLVEETQANSFGHFSNPNAKDSDKDGLDDGRETTTDAANWDTDGDTIADSQEAPGCATAADCDGDGLSDAQENAGWDVNVDGVIRHVTSDPAKIDSDGDGVDDFTEYKAKMDPRADDTDGDGLSDSEELFAVACVPTSVDGDQDGLPDSVEVLQTRTNCAMADSDSDGLDDGVELAGWTITVNGASRHVDSDPLLADSDPDSLSDGQEYLLHTDPRKQDTDGDGDPDDLEADNLGNPTTADSDGDGLTDPQENRLGTNPYARDSDGDLLDDYAETQIFHTDPWASDTDSDGLPDVADPDPLIENAPPAIVQLRSTDYGSYVEVLAVDQSFIHIDPDSFLFQADSAGGGSDCTGNWAGDRRSVPETSHYSENGVDVLRADFSPRLAYCSAYSFDVVDEHGNAVVVGLTLTGDYHCVRKSAFEVITKFVAGTAFGAGGGAAGAIAFDVGYDFGEGGVSQVIGNAPITLFDGLGAARSAKYSGPVISLISAAWDTFPTQTEGCVDNRSWTQPPENNEPDVTFRSLTDAAGHKLVLLKPGAYETPADPRTTGQGTVARGAGLRRATSESGITEDDLVNIVTHRQPVQNGDVWTYCSWQGVVRYEVTAYQGFIVTARQNPACT